MEANSNLPAWLPEILDQFPEATAELLEQRGLQKRVDTKFILDSNALRYVL